MATVAGPTALYPEVVACRQPGCGGVIVWESNACSLCLATIEPPNVRWASSEVGELDRLYGEVRDALRARGAEDVATAYEAAINSSVAVFAVPFDYALGLLDGRRRHQNYHAGVHGRARVAARPADDAMRLSVDAQIFGSVGSRITMAALSLDRMGLPTYGDVFIEFSERMCSTRASLLAENSFDFVRRHPGGPAALPPGYRSTWADRGRLAIVAAADRLDAATDPAVFPRVLMSRGLTRDADRFMEVHLYESWGIDAVVAMRMHDGPALSKHQAQLAEELGDRLRARGLVWDRVK